MSTLVTIELPDDVDERVAYLAQVTGREIPEVVANTVKFSLAPVDFSLSRAGPTRIISDEEVLKLADSRMNPEADRRFSALLDRQLAGTLPENDQLVITSSRLISVSS